MRYYHKNNVLASDFCIFAIIEEMERIKNGELQKIVMKQKSTVKGYG